MTGPFAAHPGTHAAPKRLSFFRRLVRPWWRKAAPAGVAAGAAAALIAPARFDCCIDCITEDVNECDPPNNHPVRCSEGCNDAAPVLGDQTIADVREKWNAWHDDTPAPSFIPRRHDDTMPAGFPVLTPGQQAAHAAAMHDLSARYLPSPPRPVNGRSLPDQPRRQPVYGERPQLDVQAAERDAARAAGARARTRYQPPPVELLRQLLEGVKAL